MRIRRPGLGSRQPLTTTRKAGPLLRLHVLTAVTRPENLPALAESIAAAAAEAPDVAVVWHWRFDPERRNVGGHGLKNEMLDRIQDGWVWILDDDNLMLPEFLRELAQIAAREPRAAIIACAQKLPHAGVRPVSRATLREQQIDAAQVVARRDAIGASRMPERYSGDGAFIEEISRRLPDQRIVYVETPIVAYNAIAARNARQTPSD